MTRTEAKPLVSWRLTAGLAAAMAVAFDPAAARASIAISAIWANDGGKKVVRESTPASTGGKDSVLNEVWNGKSVRVFGARNEVVAFNLVLEAAKTTASRVSVKFDRLVGPGGAVIESAPAHGSDDLFDWTRRPVENFFVRYLPIEGLSTIFYPVMPVGQSDERHIPVDLQRPWTEDGRGSGTWKDRPNAGKAYPEIAVPLESVQSFTIAEGTSQSIWTDIYIPRFVPAGLYRGTMKVYEHGTLTSTVPVELKVRDFSLPDVPASKTMLYLSYGEVNRRYLRKSTPAPDSALAARSRRIIDRHFLMARRHRITLIDSNQGPGVWEHDHPRPEWIPRLDGTLYSEANGYDGPGKYLGNDIYCVGAYGSWSWQLDDDEDSMRLHTDRWASWFAKYFPKVERFLYLVDESAGYAQIERWSSWIRNNPGPGRSLLSFATIHLPDAVEHTPSLDIAASIMDVGPTDRWEAAAQAVHSVPGRKFFLYNGKRPASGSFAIEDDGVALRELAWGQFKKKVDRWFYWQSTYYNNFQGQEGDTRVFETAQTFGTRRQVDPILGQTGWNYANGDGVLFYPGTDAIFPEDSYELDGPIASLRLKHWRRGIQDADYLDMASRINPALVAAIVQSVAPKILWEVGVSNPDDPTWVRSEIGWSIDPDDWERARAALADIIEQQGGDPK